MRKNRQRRTIRRTRQRNRKVTIKRKAVRFTRKRERRMRQSV